jgi:hypothetical protein
MTRTLTAAAVSAALILTTQHAAAQVFTCTVGDRKVYQSTPCAAGDSPIELHVPAPAEPQSRSSIEEQNQRWLQERAMKRQQADRIVEQRAQNARAERQAKERAEAEKNRITSAKFNNQVILGMTADDVRDAWGRPIEINRSQYQPGVYREQWVYRRKGKLEFVYLVNGKVTARN